MLLVHLGLVQMELETSKKEFSDKENELTACLHGRLQLSLIIEGCLFVDMMTVIMLSVILLNVVPPPNLIC
jgi:hypothetical protein